jgi:Na+/H+-translocating membrane pyrophosphatase
LRKPRQVFAGRTVVFALSALILTALPRASRAGEAIELPEFSYLPLIWPVIWFVMACAIIGLLFGLKWLFAVLKESPGSKGMVEVGNAIQDGAWTYLKRQMFAMVWFVAIIAIGLFFLYRPIGEFQYIGALGIPVYLGVSLAFIMGVAFSYLAGLIGMMMAVKANVRVANAALSSFKRALYIAFRAGSISGMATVGLGLLGACHHLLYVRRAVDEGAHRLRLRRMSRCAVHEDRRRHLHQGCRCRRRPCW